jgi:sarcosine oxidase subunit gamma
MMHHHHPLVGRRVSGVQHARLDIHPHEDCARFILRTAPQTLATASRVWGADLPEKIGGLVSSSGRIATCLGPDEWYLLAPLAQQEAIEREFEQLYATAVHSLVDVGHREVGIAVEGADAVLALQSCIAFDIGTMPIGSGCRTVMDKAQIILLRETEDRFRVEVWHSFADHVWHLLQGISHELELGI